MKYETILDFKDGNTPRRILTLDGIIELEEGEFFRLGKEVLNEPGSLLPRPGLYEVRSKVIGVYNKGLFYRQVVQAYYDLELKKADN